jgi:hypothetical protein
MNTELKEEILREYNVKALARALNEDEIKDKDIAVAGLYELSEALDDMSNAFCEPPFDGIEAWAQVQKIREACQDAIYYFKGMK